MTPDLDILPEGFYSVFGKKYETRAEYNKRCERAFKEIKDLLFPFTGVGKSNSKNHYHYESRHNK
jgi:hypothetical protein